MLSHNSIVHLNTASPAATVEGRVHRRSAVACKNCNARKVRCNVASSGLPCANCQHDRAACEIFPRKKHSRKRTKSSQVVEPQPSRGISPTGSAQPGHGSPLEDRGFSSPAPSQGTLPTSQQDLRPPLTVQHAPSESLRKDAPRASCEDEAANSTAYALALDANTAEEPKDAVIYIGDRQGASNFVFDLCNGPSQASHYMVPHVMTSRSQRPEDLAYLRLKGCFSLPPPDICEDLIRIYFWHVHPFLPILDAVQFLEGFVENHTQKIHLLPLWSVFFAATNFVDAEILQRAGYSSRKAMKRAMYQNAKCLYDSDYEEDKVSLIQSVILMSFWYCDTEDRTGAWHWIGIAIGLCQTLGLHRSPKEGIVGCRLSPGLMRRIWWSCFVRDRWLSLSMGRPMRIQVEDCDTPMPTIEDITLELDRVPLSISRKFLPDDPDKRLAALWIGLLKLSVALGTMIRIFYRLKGANPDLEDMKKCEEEILECAPTSKEEVEEPTLLFHSLQLQLFYESTVIVLHRPYLLQTPNKMFSPEEASWQAHARQKARASATKINVLLERLIDMDMIKFLKSMSVTSLIPVMQVHLLESTSANQLFRKFGSHKLRLCMLVLSELRGTFWGADPIYRLFERAEAKLLDRQTRVSADDTLRSSVDATLLTPESSQITQMQPEDTTFFSDNVYECNEFLWDELGLDHIMNDGNFPPYDLASTPGLI